MGSFSMAPSGPWTCERLSVPLKPGKVNGTSLFCFTVALTANGGKKKLHEIEILKEAQRRYAHVFACDHWTVYSDTSFQLSPGQAFKIDYPKGDKRPNTKNWVNTPLFFNVWKNIKEQTTWKSFPWIVKADPVSVFIPQRLRWLLSTQLVTDNGIFLENCKDVRMSFHGSLEVMSGTAFSALVGHMEDCKKELPYTHADRAHFHDYGEDKFAAWCMEKHGVDKIPSLQVIESLSKHEPIQGLHLAASCPSHRSKFELKNNKWHPSCTRSKTAAMFPYRTVAKWVKCLEQTKAYELH